MIKKCWISVILIISSFSSIRSQDMQWDWSYVPLGSGESYAVCVITDDNKNIYALGHFSNQLTIGNDNLIATPDYDDIFIIKFSSYGLPLFIKQISSPGYLGRGSIVVDKQENLYFASSYGTEITLDSVTINSTSVSSGILAGYSATGKLRWVNEITTDRNINELKLAIDSNNQIYLGGNYANTLNIDTITRGPHIDIYENFIFIAVFDSLGNCHRITDANTGSEMFGLNDIVADKVGNIFISATVYNSDLGNGVTVNSMHETPLLARYNPSGLCQWAKIADFNVGFGEAFDLSISDYGRVYQTGMYLAEIFFEKDTLLSPEEGTMEDIFLVEYDTSGNELNAYAYRSEADAGDFGLCYLPADSGRGYMLGLFGDRIILGNDTLVEKPDTISQFIVSSNVFISKIGSDGKPLWGKYAGWNGDRYFGEITTTAIELYLAGYTYQYPFKNTTGTLSKKAFIARAALGNDTIPGEPVIELSAEMGMDPVLFPNPSAGKLNLSGLEGKEMVMSIYDVRGTLILRKNIPDNVFTYALDIAHLRNGIYIVQLKNDTYTANMKLMKTD